MAYVDLAYVKLVGSMPAPNLDEVEALYPGTVAALAIAWSRIFDARLCKRYLAPFADPPEVLRYHVAQCVACDIWRKHGYNPGSAQDGEIAQAKTDALAWLKEAADSKEGLVELPTREAEPTDMTAVQRGGPMCSSDVDAYAWIDTEADRLG